MPEPSHRRVAALAAIVLASGALLSVVGQASAVADAGPGFPARFTAPYVESWGEPEALARAREATGLSYFTLAFVLSDGGCAGALDGTTSLDDQDWQAAIKSLRGSGGDVMASLGGGRGRELALACESVDSLKAAYRRVIDTLGLTRIDFDIEGSTIDDGAANDRRNQALAELQREYAAAGRPLAVQYTLPVNPWGLSPDAVELLQNAHDHGLGVSVVNIMAMDYYRDDLDMGDAAIRAAMGLHAQLASIWPEKSDEQLWAMEGCTPMLGVDDTGDEVFGLDDAKRLAAFATEKGMGLLAFWALGRDRPCAAVASYRSDGCSGAAQQPYDFTRALNLPAPPARRATPVGQGPPPEPSLAASVSPSETFGVPRLPRLGPFALHQPQREANPLPLPLPVPLPSLAPAQSPSPSPGPMSMPMPMAGPGTWPAVPLRMNPPGGAAARAPRAWPVFIP
ncbi:chitinase [Kitasatospora sp. MAP12-15]|uniref:chitinase n=1 Tax=unclassified Kitasatospora TaxID=2633591 RepID=UPI0024742ABF|nr:chitinase [Kitasatospora sp. MAP12-44]MDH6115056.1 chitinase [Kitasatospora sp. MAP12-44]